MNGICRGIAPFPLSISDFDIGTPDVLTSGDAKPKLKDWQQENENETFICSLTTVASAYESSTLS
jgi:hypothetical protein